MEISFRCILIELLYKSSLLQFIHPYAPALSSRITTRSMSGAMIAAKMTRMKRIQQPDRATGTSPAGYGECSVVRI